MWLYPRFPLSERVPAASYLTSLYFTFLIFVSDTVISDRHMKAFSTISCTDFLLTSSSSIFLKFQQHLLTKPELIIDRQPLNLFIFSDTFLSEFYSIYLKIESQARYCIFYVGVLLLTRDTVKVSVTFFITTSSKQMQDFMFLHLLRLPTARCGE